MQKSEVLVKASVPLLLQRCGEKQGGSECQFALCVRAPSLRHHLCGSGWVGWHKPVSQMAPFSLFSALLLTTARREYAMWDATSAVVSGALGWLCL